MGRVPVGKPVKLSAMHHQHLELGAVMVDSDGWQRPDRYTSPDRELQQLQSSVGLHDISPAGKISLQGKDLDPVLNTALPDMVSLRIGTVRRGIVSSGAAIGPVVVARLAEDEMMVLTGSDEGPSVFETLEEQSVRCAHVVDVTSALAGVRITGPSGDSLLASLTELDVSPQAFPDMSCAQAMFLRIHGVLLRLDISDLPSYEFYFSRDFGQYMWDLLLEAGEEYNLIPCGIEAMARLQKET